MSLRTTRRRSWPVALLTLLSFLATFVPPRISRADALAGVPSGTGGPTSLGGPPAPSGTPQALATVSLSTGSAQTSYPFQLVPARGAVQPSLGLTYDSSRGVGFAGMGWTLNVPSIVRRGAAGIPLFTDDLTSSQADDYLVDGQLLVPICTFDPTSASPSCPGALASEVLPTSSVLNGPGPWTYFRRETDDGMRYFKSGDGQTFVAEVKGGRTLQFGHPLDGSFTDGIERPEAATVDALSPGVNAATAVYRWNLVRDSDASGNTVSYTWTDNSALLPSGMRNSGLLYLSDIYDTASAFTASGRIASTIIDYAHHVHLTWQLSDSITDSRSVPYSPVWRAYPFAQLQTVDVTSATQTSAQRQLVRRYQLAYTTNDTATRSFLQSITLTGNCGAPVSPIPEGDTGLLPAMLSECATLPAQQPIVTYDYYGPGPSINGPQIALSTTPLSFGSEDAPAGKFLDINGDAMADFLAAPAAPEGGLYELAFGPLGTHNTLQGWTGFDNSNLPDPGDVLGSGIWGDWASAGRLDWLMPFGSVTADGDAWIIGGEAWTIGAPTTSLPPGYAEAMAVPSSVPAYPSQDLASTYPGPTWTPDHAVDVNGDGLTDATLVADPSIPSSEPAEYITYLTSRDRSGATRPFAFRTEYGCPNASMDPTSYGVDARGNPTAVRAMADMDGDGVPDLVVLAKRASNQIQTYVMPGRGDGRYGVDGASVSCRNDEGLPATSPATPLTDPISSDALNESIVRMGDVDGDGLDDVVVFDTQGLHVCVRTGLSLENAAFSCATTNVAGFLPSAPGDADVQFADLDGTGVQRIVVRGASGNPASPTYQYTAVTVKPYSQALGTTTPAPRPGLLHTVSTAAGASTQLSYATVASLGLTAPVPRWVVTSSYSTNGLVGVGAHETTVTYDYATPIYDARDRQFLGFQKVTETVAGSAGAPGLVRTTTFGTQACAAAPGSNACAGYVDYGEYRASRGLPEVVEERELEPLGGLPGGRVGNAVTGARDGPMLRTTRSAYSLSEPYRGMDGRRVRMVSLFQQYVYLWDAAEQAATSLTVPLWVSATGGPHVILPPGVAGASRSPSRSTSPATGPSYCARARKTPSVTRPPLLTSAVWAPRPRSSFRARGTWPRRIPRAGTTAHRPWSPPARAPRAWPRGRRGNTTTPTTRPVRC